MFVEEYSRYTLLSQGNSATWNLDKKTVILVCVLTLPVFIFCATYMTLIGIYEKILYPDTHTLKEVPQQWLHRALLYNTLSNRDNFTQNLYLNVAQDEMTIKKYKLVCYYNFPTNADSLQVDDLDPSMCTHMNVGFVQVYNNSIFLDTSEQNLLKRLIKLKYSNSELKILLSIGGAGAGNGFPEMVLNHTNRKSFIKSVIYYVKNYQIDGIDLDWEFPNENPGTDKNQRMHFTQLLEELRNTINRQPKYNFLVSVAVASPTNIIENSYDVSYMNDYVDFINLMSYDYHFYTKVTPFTGINAPLYASDSEEYYLATLNINYSTNYWHYLGMDRSKIIVGLPTFGHSFTLANSKNSGLYAPSFGYGKLGSQGFADYAQICLFLSANHISPVFDMDTKSPYASKYFEWISFDDPQSLTYKAEYIRDNQLGVLWYIL
ncbi:hypothetical protein NQ314_007327 [Rhamnusium bicolor]|uniref:GH18 domain-containing protein n=1 Tax=Rhamnusium bicolor TaxID=1586634 RepID=A0AAV8YST1_9CUCU|nr:hypothetical protein NQ314_007327 [Rhamnusium bicolor]